jgi:hypothetical protein
MVTAHPEMKCLAQDVLKKFWFLSSVWQTNNCPHAVTDTLALSTNRVRSIDDGTTGFHNHRRQQQDVISEPFLVPDS